MSWLETGYHLLKNEFKCMADQYWKNFDMDCVAQSSWIGRRIWLIIKWIGYKVPHSWQWYNQSHTNLAWKLTTLLLYYIERFHHVLPYFITWLVGLVGILRFQKQKIPHRAEIFFSQTITNEKKSDTLLRTLSELWKRQFTLKSRCPLWGPKYSWDVQLSLRQYTNNNNSYFEQKT